ncbi:MAG: enoyl-CoA hydratase-related protein [Ottowia sp.]
MAASTASFSLPEVGLGTVAECGGLFRGPRALPLNIARELLLTGAPLGRERAHALGTVNHLTEPGQALPEALALARQIRRASATGGARDPGGAGAAERRR